MKEKKIKLYKKKIKLYKKHIIKKYNQMFSCRLSLKKEHIWILDFLELQHHYAIQQRA